MFDIQGGSIMDSNAFMPKPKKKIELMPQAPRYNAYSKQNLRKIRPSNLTQPIRTASTLFSQFQKIRSPQYQIQKTRRQLAEIEDRKKLVELRKTLQQEKEMLDEAKREERAETISDLKNKLWGKKKFISEGGKRSIYE